ncbi:hypothetical protein EC991_007301, partial [Linnemannia zychae]
MTPRKQPSGKAPQWQYEYYSKFFLDPPEAAEIWSKPFKKLDPDEVMQDPLDEKLKAGILSERRFLGKGSDVNVLRAVWFLVHRIPDFPIIQDGVTIPLIPRDQGGAFKVLTTELSHTEPTLRGISQKALRGMYERVIRNYKEMTHFISEHREYRTPSTIMWRAVGELLRLDRLYRTERSEDSDDLSGPKDNTPQEEEQGEYKDETFNPFDYQDDAHGTAHMEDMIRALHRDTRIQMANMRSIIETQQAQLESLQDTLDTILRRIPMGPSPSSHQQQGRRSVSQLGTIDEQYYEQEDDRRHRRYSLNHD